MSSASERFSSFLEQYHAQLLADADAFLTIMRYEITGIYGTVAADERACKQWDEFLEYVESPATFKEKFARYQELKRSACGLPAGAMQ